MSTYNSTWALVAYDSGAQGQQRKHFEWRRSFMGVQCNSPQDPVYRILPGTSQTVFNGVRATSLDNTTQLTLSLSNLANNRYRFTWTAGTNPVFRTDRGLIASGHTLTLATAPNGTANLSSSTTGEFTAVQISDIVYVPGLATGDIAGPFDEINTGEWIVIGKDGPSTTLYLQREPDMAFDAISQVVQISSNTQIQVYSSAGVQIGDKVDITLNFALPVLQTYLVNRVTSTWFEVLASGPLPSYQVGIPSTAGIQFYTSAKKFVYVEVDQEALVRFNGDTTNTGRVSPLDPGLPDNIGWSGRSGPVWQLEIVNRSTKTMNAMVISVE